VAADQDGRSLEERRFVPSIRTRTAWVALLALLVAASAAVLGRTGRPAAAPALPPLLGRTGVWFCPHGGGPGWHGRVVVVNPGRSAVRVRISTFGADGGASIGTMNVPAQTEMYRDVPADERGTGTQVEYFGGWVGASAVVSEGAGQQQLASAEPCLAAPQPTSYLLDQATSLGETAYLVAMNPFAEAAEFDVSLYTEKRSVRPGSLTPYVVPAGRSVAIKLNDFALLGPGENTLAARVSSRIGRVVVGGTVVAANELREEAGTAGAGTRWILPAGGTSTAGRLLVFNPGTARSDLAVIAQSAGGQQLISGISGLSVPPGQIQTFPLLMPPDSSTLVESSNRQPVVAAIRASDTKFRAATAMGVTERANRWLVVPALPPGGGGATLVLQNPDRSDAKVQITLFGPFGPVPLPVQTPVTVPAGRTLQIQLPVVSIVPAAALVTSLAGRVVPANWFSPNSGAGYAVVPGLAVPPGA
jgi:Family of unknown function (DUF5719)